MPLLLIIFFTTTMPSDAGEVVDPAEIWQDMYGLDGEPYDPYVYPEPSLDDGFVRSGGDVFDTNEYDPSLYEIEPAPGSEKKYRLQSKSCKNMSTAFQCIACNCFHEARGEPIAGLILVGKVVVSRVRSRTFPNSMCDVIKDPGQFSWWGNGKRPNWRKRNMNMAKKDPAGLKKCLKVAKETMGYRGFYGLYYHTLSVNPKWNRGCKIVKRKLGAHRFYHDCSYKKKAHKNLRPPEAVR